MKNHYEDYKELAVSLTDAYVDHAIMQYFGMQSLDAAPTTNFQTKIFCLSCYGSEKIPCIMCHRCCKSQNI